MGPLGVFGIVWILGGAALLAYALPRCAQPDNSLWRTKHETWPMSRRSVWACTALFLVTGGVCLIHDFHPAWDIFAVPAFFAAGLLVAVVRWLDWMASRSRPPIR